MRKLFKKFSVSFKKISETKTVPDIFMVDEND